jgi:hypothetical protein
VQNNTVINGVLSVNATNWWPKVSRWCEQALSHGGMHTLEDLKQGVSNKDMQLWVIHVDDELTAVCITSIHIWPRLKELTAIIVAGEHMDKWLKDLDQLLVEYAKHNECSVLSAHGRKGWAKHLKTLGWKDTVITYAKEIS